MTTLILGLGNTGLSVARYLHARREPFIMCDSREQPPALAAVRAELPEVEIRLGGFDPELLARAERIVLSPGLSPALPALAPARARGVPLVGDIELFARAAQAPIVAITGSNGKSTVTSLVGAMARAAGVAVAVGGNLGTPALDLLDPAVALYVIEVSSFQLETVTQLGARAATVLNLSPDHLDRHGSFAAYAAMKARVFTGAALAVVNRDDPPAAALAAAVANRISFGLDAPPRAADWGVRADWLVRGDERVLPSAAVPLAGRHNLANALAALALGAAVGLPYAAMGAAIRSFTGLPHRCVVVAERDGIRWIDDSKGTNPGATAAALAGLVPEPSRGRAVLIAGGEGKGADFTALAEVIAAHARAVVLIGRDAPQIAAAIAGRVPTVRAPDLEGAVAAAAQFAQPGDCVLLSPACASFDLFEDYRHRGRCFAAAVARWLAGSTEVASERRPHGTESRAAEVRP